MTEIKLVRIYDHEQPAGYRILVDRLWPRGMSKVKADLAEWDKQIGPVRNCVSGLIMKMKNSLSLSKSILKNLIIMIIQRNFCKM